MLFMANCLILFLVHWCTCGLDDLPFFTCSPKYSNMRMIDTYLSLTSKWWFWCLNLNHHLLFGQTMGILLQIWCKLVRLNYMNGSHFPEKLVLVWVYFQILQQHIPTKTKLEYPLPSGVTICVFVFAKIIFPCI